MFNRWTKRWLSTAFMLFLSGTAYAQTESQIESAPTADASLIQAIVRIEERLVALLTLDTFIETAGTTELTAAA